MAKTVIRINWLGLLGLLLPLGLVGCDQSHDEALKAIEQDMRSTLTRAEQRMRELTPSRTTVQSSASEEIEKLFTIEYHVEEMPRQIPVEEMRERLRRLGSERWQCGDPLQFEQHLRFICHRRPRSYLRALGTVSGIL